MIRPTTSHHPEPSRSSPPTQRRIISCTSGRPRRPPWKPGTTITSIPYSGPAGAVTASARGTTATSSMAGRSRPASPRNSGASRRTESASGPSAEMTKGAMESMMAVNTRSSYPATTPRPSSPGSG